MMFGFFCFLVILAFVKVYFVFSAKKCTNYVSLVGKTVLVTGANTGIGFWASMEFAKRGAKLILACRNQDKALAAKTEIINKTGNENVTIKIIDMSSLDSVRQCAKEIIQEEQKLDVLVNNAGAGGLLDKKTSDGLDVLMQVNYFGPFLFTLLLLDLLKKSHNGRIINVASIMAKVTKFDPKAIGQFAGKYGTYANSKLCNILFTIKLAEKLKGTNLSVFSLHPGAVKTEIFRRVTGWRRFIFDVIAFFTFKNPEEGAQTIIYTATEPNLEEFSGKHFEECQVVPPYSATANDNLPNTVWEETLRLLQLNENYYF